MKKIAILRCLITSASCAGAGCLRTLYEKDKAFAQSAAGG
ncbi:CGGC domain-containing protein [Phascolarctobacterium succinatutens]|nr:CGGC domain-containing protein [Phascolarctobacterium succinatutens]